MTLTQHDIDREIAAAHAAYEKRLADGAPVEHQPRRDYAPYRSSVLRHPCRRPRSKKYAKPTHTTTRYVTNMARISTTPQPTVVRVPRHRGAAGRHHLPPGPEPGHEDSVLLEPGPGHGPVHHRRAHRSRSR